MDATSHAEVRAAADAAVDAADAHARASATAAAAAAAAAVLEAAGGKTFSLPALDETPWRCLSLEVVSGEEVGGNAAGGGAPGVLGGGGREKTGSTGGVGRRLGYNGGQTPASAQAGTGGGSSGSGSPPPPQQAEQQAESRTHLVFAAATDELALSWFLGLQEWLRTLGHLATPARPAKLLWARTRLRLQQRAKRGGLTPGAALARAVRAASAQRLYGGGTSRHWSHQWLSKLSEW